MQLKVSSAQKNLKNLKKHDILEMSELCSSMLFKENVPIVNGNNLYL